MDSYYSSGTSLSCRHHFQTIGPKTHTDLFLACTSLFLFSVIFQVIDIKAHFSINSNTDLYVSDGDIFKQMPTLLILVLL